MFGVESLTFDICVVYLEYTPFRFFKRIITGEFVSIVYLISLIILVSNICPSDVSAITSPLFKFNAWFT